MLSLSKYEGRAGGLAQGEALMLSLSKYEGRPARASISEQLDGLDEEVGDAA